MIQTGATVAILAALYGMFGGRYFYGRSSPRGRHWDREAIRPPPRKIREML